MRAWTLGLALFGLACGGSDGAVVAAQDERFQLTWKAESPAAPDQPGELRLRVDTRKGWKLADEAPARLKLRPSDALAFEPEAQGREDAQALGEGSFEFVTALVAQKEGRALARGEISFGVCEDGVLMCEVVHEELELPIDVAFAPEKP